VKNREALKKLMKKTFFGLLFLVIIHVIALVMRAVFLASIIAQSVEAEDGIAWGATVLFSFVIVAIFSVWRGVELARNGEARRAFLTDTAEQSPTLTFSLTRVFQRNAVDFILFAVMQLPFLIFYAAFGYYYTGGTILERFYSMEAGFYVLTGWGVLGFLISCAYYILLQTVIELIVYKLWDRDRIVH